MRWKYGLVGITYAASVLLANVCLMDITQAIEPAVPSDPIPISYVDAKECPWVKAWTTDGSATVETKRSPCESGHCITTPAPEISCFGTNDGPSSPVVLSVPATNGAWTALNGTDLPPDVTESPPLVGVTTVVLRR